MSRQALNGSFSSWFSCNCNSWKSILPRNCSLSFSPIPIGPLSVLSPLAVTPLGDVVGLQARVRILLGLVAPVARAPKKLGVVSVAVDNVVEVVLVGTEISGIHIAAENNWEITLDNPESLVFFILIALTVSIWVWGVIINMRGRRLRHDRPCEKWKFWKLIERKLPSNCWKNASSRKICKECRRMAHFHTFCQPIAGLSM